MSSGIDYYSLVDDCYGLRHAQSWCNERDVLVEDDLFFENDTYESNVLNCKVYFDKEIAVANGCIESFSNESMRALDLFVLNYNVQEIDRLQQEVLQTEEQVVEEPVIVEEEQVEEEEEQEVEEINRQVEDNEVIEIIDCTKDPDERVETSSPIPSIDFSNVSNLLSMLSQVIICKQDEVKQPVQQHSGVHKTLVSKTKKLDKRAKYHNPTDFMMKHRFNFDNFDADDYFFNRVRKVNLKNYVVVYSCLDILAPLVLYRNNTNRFVSKELQENVDYIRLKSRAIYLYDIGIAKVLRYYRLCGHKKFNSYQNDYIGLLTTMFSEHELLGSNRERKKRVSMIKETVSSC